jgi:hypothetical protein
VVDQLLYRFVALVKQGLELMLRDPSALARDEFDQHPEWVYAPADIPIWVAWAAQGTHEMAWPDFCQHVLEHPNWQALMGVQTQAALDALAAGLGHVRMRCIELAIHDLKYHKNRGWNAVQHCALFATIAMLGAA